MATSGKNPRRTTPSQAAAKDAAATRDSTLLASNLDLSKISRIGSERIVKVDFEMAASVTRIAKEQAGAAGVRLDCRLVNPLAVSLFGYSAASSFKVSLTLAPQDAAIWNNRGMAHEAKGEHDMAIADYTNAIDLSPTFYSAYQNRGDARKAKGEDAGAAADLKRAAELKAAAEGKPK